MYVWSQRTELGDGKDVSDTGITLLEAKRTEIGNADVIVPLKGHGTDRCVRERTQVQSTSWENKMHQDALHSVAAASGGVGGCWFLLLLGYFSAAVLEVGVTLR